jgi:hypothetical protein
MKMTCSPKTSVKFQRTVCHYVPEDMTTNNIVLKLHATESTVHRDRYCFFLYFAKHPTHRNWGVLSSGMRCRVVWLRINETPKERVVSISSTELYLLLPCFLAELTLQQWRRRQCVPPKHRQTSTKRQGVTYRKIVLFTVIAVRTLDLAENSLKWKF